MGGRHLKTTEEDDSYETEYEDGSERFIWNQIFAFLSPYLVIECEESNLCYLFDDFVRRNTDPSYGRVTKIYDETESD